MKCLKNYLLRGAALLMILGTTLPGWAQTYYVFHNSTQGYIYNNGSMAAYRRRSPKAPSGQPAVH